MSTIPLLGTTPVVIAGALHPNGTAYYSAATSPYHHRRKWKPDPDGPGRRRTLVLCFDGTGDSFDQDNSNVVQFLSMLKKDDPTKQLVYYQPGIGTYAGKRELGTSLAWGASKLLDEMIAVNLPEHIKGGYQFLMQTYHEGDNICIFGFSRGAFTAVALAGMLQKVGLLPQYNIEQLEFAYSMYMRDDDEGLNLSTQFKRTFSVDVKIQFLGVWDTVESVGVIPKHLPFSGCNNAVAHFRHALALDERRVGFIPFFSGWGKQKGKGSETKMSQLNGLVNGSIRFIMENLESSGQCLEYENQINSVTGPDTDVKEVFFAGAHCDVGGGSVKNGTRHSLARIPLRWMIRECFKVHSGIIFDAHMLKHEVGLDVNSIHAAPEPLSPESHRVNRPRGSEVLGFSFSPIFFSLVSGLVFPFRWLWGGLKSLRLHKEPKAPFSLKLPKFEYKGEAQEELNDALSPIYDQLHLCWYWKVMEWIPRVIKKQFAEVNDSKDVMAYKFVWNRGKGRRVYNTVKVHRSVKTRMLAQAMQGDKEPYLPKIRCLVDGKSRYLKREEWLADESVHFQWVD